MFASAVPIRIIHDAGKRPRDRMTEADHGAILFTTKLVIAALGRGQRCRTGNELVVGNELAVVGQMWKIQKVLQYHLGFLQIQE